MNQRDRKSFLEKLPPSTKCFRDEETRQMVPGSVICRRREAWENRRLIAESEVLPA
jgi:hypothetical protein